MSLDKLIPLATTSAVQAEAPYVRQQTSTFIVASSWSKDFSLASLKNPVLH